MRVDPHNLLNHVHPDLVKVIVGASQDEQPFQVVCGLRALDAEKQAVATGHSQTTHSRHLAGQDGFACAVDVAALTDGHINWSSSVYAAIAAEIKAVAKTLNVPVEWGGDWHSFKDWGHFQLPWEKYP